MKSKHKPHWLQDDSEMGGLIQSKDWGSTPLGPIESWSHSLKTTVSLCLNTNFPLLIVWGQQQIQIYNDRFRLICGEKHPDSMGQNFKECWTTTWPVVGDAFEQALSGKANFLENQRMFLDRFGYLEETFFTFSFSPIYSETGEVLGLFIPVIETTEKMLSERRGDILRELSVQSSKAETIEDAAKLTINCLKEYKLDRERSVKYSNLHIFKLAYR